MDPGEWELHLRFHAGDLRHAESRGTTSGVPEQCRLADACLASDDHHGALALARACQDPVEHVALADPVKQPGRRGGSHLVGTLPAVPMALTRAQIRDMTSSQMSELRGRCDL